MLVAGSMLCFMGGLSLSSSSPSAFPGPGWATLSLVEVPVVVVGEGVWFLCGPELAGGEAAGLARAVYARLDGSRVARAGTKRDGVVCCKEVV